MAGPIIKTKQLIREAISLGPGGGAGWGGDTWLDLDSCRGDCLILIHSPPGLVPACLVNGGAAGTPPAHTETCVAEDG